MLTSNYLLFLQIAAVFSYLCVVTLQYLAPLIMCLFLSFMYKTLGEFQWSWLINGQSAPECSAAEEPLAKLKDLTGQSRETEPVEELFLTLDSLKAVSYVR